MEACFAVTQSFEPACRGACTDAEYPQLRKAFFEKRENLDSLAAAAKASGQTGTEEAIARLFRRNGLGVIVPPITPVSGGFLHRMYRVDTADRSYAVKHLNPNIMRRPEAMGNFRRAEALERVLEDAGIPIVPALTIGGSKLQEQNGDYFYVFPWQNGTVTDWYHISAEQCRQAGSILGRIHAVDPRRIPRPEPERSAVDWAAYIEAAAAQGSEIAPLLKENEELLAYAEASMNEARTALPGIECITDEDMDPKNVMWAGGKPLVIDLECLEYGNPVSGALQLSLQWAGVTTCSLDFNKLKAFFDGYLAAWDCGFRDYDRVFGLAYTWIEWLEYNVRRALGDCRDEAEREMGSSQVRETLVRLRHLRALEDRIVQSLRLWLRPPR